jgi:hypothetical protein
MRMIIGTIVGILLAFGLIYMAQMVGNTMSPGVYDPASEEVQIPLANTILLFVGWFIGTFAGAWVAMRTTAMGGPGWVVAGAVIGAALYRAFTLGDAIWVIAAAFIVPLAAAWLAARAVRTAAS